MDYLDVRLSPSMSQKLFNELWKLVPKKDKEKLTGGFAKMMNDATVRQCAADALANGVDKSLLAELMAKAMTKHFPGLVSDIVGNAMDQFIRAKFEPLFGRVDDLEKLLARLQEGPVGKNRLANGARV